MLGHLAAQVIADPGRHPAPRGPAGAAAGRASAGVLGDRPPVRARQARHQPGAGSRACRRGSTRVNRARSGSSGRPNTPAVVQGRRCGPRGHRKIIRVPREPGGNSSGGPLVSL
jgi:hypothetical protein